MECPALSALSMPHILFPLLKQDKVKDLGKVNSLQLYSFWKHLSIGLLAVIALMTLSRVFPFYAAPIIATLCAVVLYTLLYSSRFRDHEGCGLSIYALFRCTVNYTVISVVLNLLTIWKVIALPTEFIFLTSPYIPSLLLHPVCFLTTLYLYVRKRHLKICAECKLRSGGLYERGKSGQIFRYESYFQLRNLLFIFGILSVAVWAYYIFAYLPMTINSRDWYVFMWLTVIVFLFDEIYFIYRYYNLYLDLKENDEIITPDELNNMTAKTYMRFYLVCGNKLYVDPHSVVPGEEREVIETPFITRRAVNGIPAHEVKNIVARMTGINDGELRFFYGRKSLDVKNRSLLRYFYFLDGDVEQYSDIPTEGVWMDFDEIKKIYSRTPGRLSPRGVADITRLATIMLTEKIFDEKGIRKSRIKSYRPTFNLEDVRESKLDFQDDKWIKISMFNSDMRFFHLRRWWRNRNKSRAAVDNTWESKL